MDSWSSSLAERKGGIGLYMAVSARLCDYFVVHESLTLDRFRSKKENNKQLRGHDELKTKDAVLTYQVSRPISDAQ